MAEYIPSPVKWVREQVELYERSGGTQGTTLRDTGLPVIIVTNEVGSGIVPDNALAREFRDAAGLLNQWVAAVADDVILAVAGLPLKVK